MLAVPSDESRPSTASLSTPSDMATSRDTPDQLKAISRTSFDITRKISWRPRASFDAKALAKPSVTLKTVVAARQDREQDRAAAKAANAVALIIRGNKTSAASASKSPAVPNLSSTQLKKLKKELVSPAKARRIFQNLKTLDHGTAEPAPVGHPPDDPRGICLQCTDDEAIELGSLPHTPSSAVVKPAVAHTQEASLATRLRSLVVSPGEILARTAQQTGALDALADATAAIVSQTAPHSGAIVPPRDRMSVYICTIRSNLLD